MKLELIRNNLAICENAAESGDNQKAAKIAYQIARLLLMQAAAFREGREVTEVEVRETFIALVGVAGAIQMQLSALPIDLDVSAMNTQLKARVQEVREAFADLEEEVKEFEKLNHHLMEEEEKLRTEKAKKEKEMEKVDQLTEIKEKELKRLQEKIDKQKQALREMETEYARCEEIYATVEAELLENSVIMQAFPDSVGIQSVDDLIAQAKRQRVTLEQAGLNSSSSIRQIIEELQRVQRLAAGEALA